MSLSRLSWIVKAKLSLIQALRLRVNEFESFFVKNMRFFGARSDLPRLPTMKNATLFVKTLKIQKRLLTSPTLRNVF